VFVVTKLGPLARSVADLCAIVTRIEAKCAALRILAKGLALAKTSTRPGADRSRQERRRSPSTRRGMTREAIAAQLKISVASVYRVLRAA
jgi:DNA invertase Pin-like site-specific DNA recombinase